MGYLSDVTIVMYPRVDDDYPMLKLFVDENLPDEFEEHEVERSFREVVFLKGGSTFFKYLMLELDSVKWYEGYEGVDVYTRLFSEWDSKFRNVTDPEGEPLFHYEFMRIGEDYEDIVYDRSVDSDMILNIERRAYVSI
jgi:hypothetical protein